MILLFGTRAYETVLLVVTMVCGLCGVQAAQRVVERRTKLTVFFLPLLSLSTSRLLECEHCGRVTALTRGQAEHAQRWAAVHA